MILRAIGVMYESDLAAYTNTYMAKGPGKGG